jgi:RHS repeat-associated protein
MNRVVKRTTNGVPLFLIYDGWSLIEERDGSGAVLQKYVNGSIDEVLIKINTVESVYYHQDGLGSVTQLTNLSGSIVEKYAYDIFGKASIFGGLNLQPVASSLHSNRFQFTGREWLSEAGLYDYRNRVYSCELGRFLQADPIRFIAGDVNIYRYVGNDVLNGLDSFGLAEIRVCTSDWYVVKDDEVSEDFFKTHINARGTTITTTYKVTWRKDEKMNCYLEDECGVYLREDDQERSDLHYTYPTKDALTNWGRELERRKREEEEAKRKYWERYNKMTERQKDLEFGKDRRHFDSR